MPSTQLLGPLRGPALLVQAGFSAHLARPHKLFPVGSAPVTPTSRTPGAPGSLPCWPLLSRLLCLSAAGCTFPSDPEAHLFPPPHCLHRPKPCPSHLPSSSLQRLPPALSRRTPACCGSAPKTASRVLLFKDLDRSISLVCSEPSRDSPSLSKRHISNIVICLYSLTLSLHTLPFLPL